MAAFAYPFLVLAGLGFGLSALSHLFGLLGLKGPVEQWTGLLDIGIFLVCLPAAYFSRRLSPSGRPLKWKVLLRGCPAWMQSGVIALLAYAAFVLIFFHEEIPGRRFFKMAMAPAAVRWLSGLWMLAYGLAFAILYSYLMVGDSLRRCTGGHTVEQLGLFCKECGQAVEDDRDS